MSQPDPGCDLQPPISDKREPIDKQDPHVRLTQQANQLGKELLELTQLQQIQELEDKLQL